MTYETAVAKLADLEAMGDLGADHDAEKNVLREAIRLHDELGRNGIRPAPSGADLSFREVVERQRAPKSASEQLAIERARLTQLEAQMGSGGASEEFALDQAREQIRHLERSVEAEEIAARLKRERAADPGDAESRGRIGAGFGRALALGARLEKIQAEKEAIVRELLAEGRGLNAEALRRGLTNRAAEMFLLRKVLGRWETWRLAELLPDQVGRADKALRKSLVVAIGELHSMLGEE